MTVQMLTCRRHGGKVNKYMLPDSLRTRCAFCDLERRALRRKTEVSRVPYELQVDIGHLAGCRDWYLTLRTYDSKDAAESEMNRVLPEFNSARMRVIAVVSEGASDGVQAAD